MKPENNNSPFCLLVRQQFLLIAICVGSVVTSSQASLVAWYTFDEGASAANALNWVLGGTDGVIGSGITTGVPGVPGVPGNTHYFTGLNGNQTNCADMPNSFGNNFYVVLNNFTYRNSGLRMILTGGGMVVQNIFIDGVAAVGVPATLTGSHLI